MKPIAQYSMVRYHWKRSRGISEGSYILCEMCDKDPVVAVYPIKRDKKTPENLIGLCEECMVDFDGSGKPTPEDANWALDDAKYNIKHHKILHP